MKRPETPPSDDDPFNLDVDSPNKEEPGAQKTQPTLWMSENRLSLKTQQMPLEMKELGSPQIKFSFDENIGKRRETNIWDDCGYEEAEISALS